jgi:hypothetical protein
MPDDRDTIIRGPWHYTPEELADLAELGASDPPPPPPTAAELADHHEWNARRAVIVQRLRELTRQAGGREGCILVSVVRREYEANRAAGRALGDRGDDDDEVLAAWFLDHRILGGLLESTLGGPDEVISEQYLAWQQACHAGLLRVLTAEWTARAEEEAAAAYVPAKLLVGIGVKTPVQVDRFLKKHPKIRWRKPSPRRLLVHFGDWLDHFPDWRAKLGAALQARALENPYEVLDGMPLNVIAGYVAAKTRIARRGGAGG